MRCTACGRGEHLQSRTADPNSALRKTGGEVPAESSKTGRLLPHTPAFGIKGNLFPTGGRVNEQQSLPSLPVHIFGVH